MGQMPQLHKGQRLSIEGDEYRVTGGIEFQNRSDGSRWTEYCLQERKAGRARWLSVDDLYQEYAIYTVCRDGGGFDEDSLSRGGYREADSGKAEVVGCFGDVDVKPGDTVLYTEYEDGAEEHIMSVEQWEDGTEHSRGYYLDLDEVVPLDGGADGAFVAGNRKTAAGFFNIKTLAIVVVGLAALGVCLNLYLQSHQKTIRRYLEKDARFVYQTSITSDLNSKEKADVYTTELSVDDAVKAIIQAIEGGTEDVQKSEEGDSVAVLTKDEYCLAYTSTDQITTVQISSRAYAYQSTNTPYHASPRTHAYYRGFYYTRGFWGDRDRYARSVSGYEGYRGGTVEVDPNDPYRSYSDSVRQSSINSRKSSGGGISSGK